MPVEYVPEEFAGIDVPHALALHAPPADFAARLGAVVHIHIGKGDTLNVVLMHTDIAEEVLQV